MDMNTYAPINKTQKKGKRVRYVGSKYDPLRRMIVDFLTGFAAGILVTSAIGAVIWFVVTMVL